MKNNTPAVASIYLENNFFMDFEHPDIQAYVQKHTHQTASVSENVISLYDAVRDGFRYNPYRISLRPEGYRASAFLSQTEGHCIDKANLFGACCRAIGVASRMRFANVKNHIGTEKLEARLGTSTLVFHGAVDVFLAGKWVTATPAFNRELCEMLGVSALEFDGKHDSCFQEFDKRGGKFMVYLHDYGHFPEIPFALMLEEWRKHYPIFSEKYTQETAIQF